MENEMYLVDDVLHFCNVSLKRCPAIRSNRIRYYDFTFVIEGEMTYIIDGEKISLFPGDAIFLPPETLRKRIEGTQSVQFVSFNFTKAKGVDLSFPRFLQGIISKNMIDMVSVFPRLHISKYDYSKQKVAAILNYLLYELKCILQYGTTQPQVLKAICFIEENLGKDISLSHVSRHLSLSKEYTASLFKKTVGKTVNRYISEKKMMLAREMIREGQMSLGDIALSLGFQNYNYFSRTFSDHFEVSPAKYRSIFREKQ